MDVVLKFCRDANAVCTGAFIKALSEQLTSCLKSPEEGFWGTRTNFPPSPLSRFCRCCSCTGSSPPEGSAGWKLEGGTLAGEEKPRDPQHCLSAESPIPHLFQEMAQLVGPCLLSLGDTGL